MGTVDTFGEFERLRSECPISQPRDGLHLVTGYAEAVAVLTDEQAFAARHANDGPMPTRLLLRQDGAHHDSSRRIVARALGARHVLESRPSIQAHGRALVAQLVERGGGDVVADFAVPLVSTSVADFVGLPREGRERVLGWVAEMAQDDRAVPQPLAGRSAHAAREAFATFLGEQIEARRRHAHHSDAISRLLEPDPVTGVTITDAEVAVHMRNLCQATTPTGLTVSLIANLVYELLLEPARYQQVQNQPELILTAVEESLRHDPPNNFARRVCIEPVQVHATRIEEGEKVMVSIASSNRDTSQFSNGEAFRLDRGRQPAHLAFGWGPHYCIGAFLARTVAACALRSLVEQDRMIRIAPGYRYERRAGLAGLATHGPIRLDVNFEGPSPVSAAT